MSHRPRKRFGQNFLQDRSVIDRIVRSIAPTPQQTLVEIGPGRGAITLPLLRAAGRLHVVELDRDLIAPLARTCAGLGELEIHSADALQFDFCALAPPDGRLRLVGNLPYNISTPLLFHLLAQASCIDDMHFMLQKEVVERMAAAPGSKAYGRLSVMLQAHCTVEALFDIGPQAFRPAPKVHSALVRVTPCREPRFTIEEPALFARIVAQAFSQRRKTLRNSLQKILLPEVLTEAGIDPQLRAERLAVADFVRLCNQACKSAAPT